MKANAVTILQALLDGAEIEKDGETYIMDELHRLCVKRTKLAESRSWNITLAVGFGSVSLAEFIRWADTFKEDEIVIICANRVLNRHA